MHAFILWWGDIKAPQLKIFHFLEKLIRIKAHLVGVIYLRTASIYWGTQFPDLPRFFKPAGFITAILRPKRTPKSLRSAIVYFIHSIEIKLRNCKTQCWIDSPVIDKICAEALTKFRLDLNIPIAKHRIPTIREMVEIIMKAAAPLTLTGIDEKSTNSIKNFNCRSVSENAWHAQKCVRLGLCVEQYILPYFASHFPQQNLGRSCNVIIIVMIKLLRRAFWSRNF